MSDLGAREAGNLGTAAVSERRAAINERRRRNPILRAGGGLVNPDYHCLRAILPSPVAVNPGARHVTTASHTAGQTATRISKHNRGDGLPSTACDQTHGVSRDLEQHRKIARHEATLDIADFRTP